MNRLNTNLRYLPTLLSILLILWFTIAPDPVPEDTPELWPGADKCVHLLIMGFVTAVWLTDRFRRRTFSWWPSVLITFAVIAMAALIEVVQGAMGLGRSCDINDWIAGSVGAVAAACAWLLGRFTYQRQS
ncbi:MAG: VanZ family protein [Muribaculaceae bacterium]|nr:VanZ family protein [Muribaculaceae bacterium]